ncbi:MAG TPA: hypothetical protein VFC02_24125 [Anaerolineales bacterium]|nr:hypothetical protein [Anaerolineales bacterium]
MDKTNSKETTQPNRVYLPIDGSAPFVMTENDYRFTQIMKKFEETRTREAIEAVRALVEAIDKENKPRLYRYPSWSEDSIRILRFCIKHATNPKDLKMHKLALRHAQGEISEPELHARLIIIDPDAILNLYGKPLAGPILEDLGAKDDADAMKIPVEQGMLRIANAQLRKHK